jgi:rhodanese-related sulfurtransferase
MPLNLLFSLLYIIYDAMKRYIFSLLFALAIFNTARPQLADSLKYTVISPAEFLQRSGSTVGAVIVDVRDSKDYKKSRIPGAVSMPFSSKTEFFTNSLGKEQTIFVYCYAGVRSKKAAAAFYNNGFRNIFSLEGGFTNWKLKKMKVERKKHS